MSGTDEPTAELFQREDRRIGDFYEQSSGRYNPQGQAQYLSDERFSRVQEAVYECGTGLRVLDIGCGNGWLGSLYSKGNEVWGLDISETNVRRAISRGIKAIKHDLNINNPLPFEARAFDVIVCSEILEHLFFPEDMLKDCYRVLKDEGMLICTVPNLYSAKNRIAILKGHDCKLIEYPANTEHIRHYSLSGFKMILELQGFSVQKVIGESYGFGIRGMKYLLWLLTFGRRERYSLVRFRLARLFGKLFPSLAPGLLFCARKQ